MTVRYLDLADLLVVAEWVLGESVESIARSARLGLAESALHAPAAEFGGVEFYPDLPTKAAVLCVRLVKNHPLVDGNKRLGFVCMIEFLRRNGCAWTPPEGDEDGELSAEVIMSVAAGPGDDSAIRDLADWIEDRISAT